ncbi:hypothetical protein PanWU01x14_065040 [Parasponia andersonii]|uniref:Uncharacterized protein n=1 Tax=Parasponia andersonii TaxID=3476 RepID=A0A2P5DGP7_PARAD|nr:hypothetical protein PanWU01x14_065040 [Parasponia andersonii]
MVRQSRRNLIHNRSSPMPPSLPTPESDMQSLISSATDAEIRLKIAHTSCHHRHRFELPRPDATIVLGSQGSVISLARKGKLMKKVCEGL